MPAALLDQSTPPDIRAFLDGLRRSGMMGEPDGLSLRHYAAAGRVDIVGRGFWTHDALARHFRELAIAADAIHAAGLSARVLVDLREAAVQSIDSAERIGSATSRLWHGHDRVAVVINSRLVTLQIARVVDNSHHRLFSDIGTAEAWLAR